MYHRFKLDKIFTGLVYLFVIIVPPYIWLVLSEVMTKTGIQYCLSDAYCFAESYCKYFIIPLAAFVVVHMLKYNFRAEYVVRMQSIRKLWLTLCEKVITLAFLVAVYLLITVTCIGSLYGQFNCNWTSKDSSAYAILQVVVTDPPSVWTVMTAYFLIVFLTVAVMGLIITLLWWIFDTPLVGYAGMIVFLDLELGMRPSPTKLFFAKVNMDPVSVYYRGINYDDMIIYPTLVLLGLIVTGYIFIRKKDFFKKQ